MSIPNRYGRNYRWNYKIHILFAFLWEKKIIHLRNFYSLEIGRLPTLNFFFALWFWNFFFSALISWIEKFIHLFMENIINNYRSLFLRLFPSILVLFNDKIGDYSRFEVNISAPISWIGPPYPILNMTSPSPPPSPPNPLVTNSISHLFIAIV